MNGAARQTANMLSWSRQHRRILLIALALLLWATLVAKLRTALRRRPPNSEHGQPARRVAANDSVLEFLAVDRGETDS